MLLGFGIVVHGHRFTLNIVDNKNNPPPKKNVLQQKYFIFTTGPPSFPFPRGRAGRKSGTHPDQASPTKGEGRGAGGRGWGVLDTRDVPRSHAWP